MCTFWDGCSHKDNLKSGLSSIRISPRHPAYISFYPHSSTPPYRQWHLPHHCCSLIFWVPYDCTARTRVWMYMTKRQEGGLSREDVEGDVLPGLSASFRDRRMLCGCVGWEPSLPNTWEINSGDILASDISRSIVVSLSLEIRQLCWCSWC